MDKRGPSGNYFVTVKRLMIVPMNMASITQMKPELYTRLVVNRDFPDEDLKKGEEGALLEIFNVPGESIGIATVPVSAIESLRPAHLPAVRELAAADTRTQHPQEL